MPQQRSDTKGQRDDERSLSTERNKWWDGQRWRKGMRLVLTYTVIGSLDFPNIRSVEACECLIYCPSCEFTLELDHVTSRTMSITRHSCLILYIGPQISNITGAGWLCSTAYYGGLQYNPVKGPAFMGYANSLLYLLTNDCFVVSWFVQEEKLVKM